MYVKFVCSAKISAAVSYISCLQQINNILANVSLGHEGGPKSKRKANFRKPATGPCRSVSAILCNVTGSNSLSALGGKSNRESLAASAGNYEKKGIKLILFR